LCGCFGRWQIDSNGIQAIGEMLQFNKGLVELNLLNQVRTHSGTRLLSRKHKHAQAALLDI